MINRIGTVIKDIQYLTDLTIDQIAAKIGYSRSHLNRSMKGEESEKLYNTLVNTFGLGAKDIAKPVKTPDPKMQYLTITPSKPGQIVKAVEKEEITLLREEIKRLEERLKKMEEEKQKLFELLNKALQK